MDLTTAIKHAIDGQALLFLGSGFSNGAKPLVGDSFLTGRELAKHLSGKCGIVPPVDELNFAAQRYRKKFDDDQLVNELKNLFTASSVSESQKRFSEIPWRSIYTTNYDNVLEKAFAERRKKLVPITPDQDGREYTAKSNSVVHINGYIESLTPAMLSNSFKLTNTSYLTESFSKSNWSFLFRRSLETCRAVIFVGYSMYDLDIQRIIYADETIKNKTIFIDRVGLTDLDIENGIQSDFGLVLPIGINGFLSEFDKVKSSYIPQDTENSFFCFEELLVSNITSDFRDDYIFDLFLKGIPQIEFIWNSVHGGDAQKYFVIRDKHSETIRAIDNSIRNVIAVSDMANGKSLFLVGLACTLMSNGYRVFWMSDEAEGTFDEIDRLCKLDQKIVLVVENYPRRLEEIRHLQLKRSGSLVLLTSAKTGSHEAYQDDLVDILDAKVSIDIDLNRLSTGELEALDGILTTYKLWGERDAWSREKKMRYLSFDCDRQFGSVLLEIIKSPEIQTRFQALFNAFRNDGELADVMVAASVLKLLGFDKPRDFLISELLDSSYLYSLDFKRNPVGKELLQLGSGHIIPRSSVLAKYGLTSFSDSRSVVDRLIKIATKAHDLGRDSQMFFGIYKELVTFSMLQSMLPEKGKRDALIRFYEAIKNLEAAQSHPHFWLQYAIARLASDGPGDLEKARLFLDTAYAHAQRRKNYHTRHMDNVKARYLIKHSIVVEEINAALIELADGHALLLKQCRTEQSVAPFKVAKLYLSFYNAKKMLLSANHKAALIKFANQILSYIPSLRDSIRTDHSIKFAKSDLESLIADIESHELI